MKKCGSCTLCCVLPELLELNKPHNVSCINCVIGTGCKIYNDRPKSCRNFECLWIVSNDMSDNLRPDLCGIMFEPHWDHGFVLAMVDSFKPNSWKESPGSDMISRLLLDGYLVVVVCGKKTHFLRPDNMTQQEAQDKVLVAIRKFNDCTGLCD